MKNKEKYANEIMEVIITGNQMAFDVTKGTVTTCYDTNCNHCLFDGDCDRDCNIADARREWLEAECVKPEIDWSKVPVDTPILVKSYSDGDWTPRYFANYKNGKVFAWCDGTTSWTAQDHASDWKYAKLMED